MKLLATLVVCLLTIGSTFSQCDPKGIFTNPNMPLNPENSAFINDFFDWRTNNFSTNSLYNPNPVASPFQNLLNGNVSHFYFSKDMKPEDGWELMKHDFGYLVDGTPRLTGHVYFILYNKYTSVLRVFLAGNNQAYNGASISIYFDPSSGVPSSAISNSSTMFALDKFEPNPMVTSATRYVNDIHNWFYADFFISYDPCTCQFDSKLRIEVKLIENAEITLSGKFDGKIAAIENKTSGEGVKHNGFSIQDIGAAAKKAQKTYKDTKGFTDDLLKAEVADKTNKSDEIEEAIQGEIYDKPVADIEAAFDAVGDPTEKQRFAEKKSILDQTKDLLQSSDLLKAGIKAVPYLGAAYELVNFFSGGGKQSPAPQVVQLTPMSINATLELSGTIQTSYTYKDITFFTPGSYGSNNALFPDAYPYYNEVLGVFNLIRTPKIYFKSYVENTSYQASGHPDYLKRSSSLSHFKFPELDLFDGVKNFQYTLNPSARINQSTIEIFGQLIFKDASNNKVFETPLLPITALNNFYVHFGWDEGEDYYGTWNETFGVGRFVPANVDLKLFLNIERLDADANTQNILQVGTYALEAVQKADVQWGTPFSSFPSNVSLSNTNVYESVKVWETITVGPNVSFSDGVILSAPEGVVVLPGATIDDHIQITTDYPVSASTFVPAESNSSINSFCNSNTYNNANRGVRVAKEENIEITESRIDVNAFPNPSKGHINFNVSVDKAMDVDLSLINLTGQEISKIYQGPVTGAHTVSFDGSHLPKGVYVYKLLCGEISLTKKLVIQ